MPRQHQPIQQERTNIRLPQELLDEMRALAVADDRSLNAEIVRALREFVERRRHGHQDADQQTSQVAC